MAGIILTIEVDDKGTVKIKQLSGETQKFFDETDKAAKKAQAPLDSYLKYWTRVTPEVDKAYEEMRKGPGLAAGPMASLLENWGKTSSSIANVGKEAQKFFDDTDKAAKKVQAPLDDLQKSWIALTAKVAAATAVVYGAARAFSSFINEAAQAEEIQNRLRYALETTGYTWQYAKQAVDSFANSIQAATRFSDDQAKQAILDMMMYTQDFAKAQEAARLAMDMSVRTGMDLTTASRYIGMAMSGNVEMLGRYIPQLRNLDAVLGSNATQAEKAAYGWKTLKEIFGGTAQADINSYAGQLAQLNNEWDDLKKTIGRFLIGPATELIKWFKDAAEGARNFFEQFKVPKTDTEALKREIDGINNQLKIMDFWFERRAAGDPLFKMSKEAAEDWSKKYDELLKRRSEIQKIFEGEKAKLAAETKKDIFTEKIKDLELSKSLTVELWQAEDKYNEESIRGADLIERRELALLKNIEAQDEWIDSLQSSIGLIGEMTLAELKESQAIDEMIDALQDLSAAWDPVWMAEEKARQGMDEWIDSTQRAYPVLSEMQESVGRIWDSLALNMSNAWSTNMTNIVKSTESGTEKMKRFFQGLGDVFVSTISKMIANAILLGNVMGEKGKEGQWGGVLGWIGSAINALVKHTGGIVGESGPTRSVPAAAFAFAPRFHSGLMPDEFPSILKRGEGVFTPEQMKALGGTEVNNTYYIDARGSQRGVSQEIMRAIRKSEERAVIRSVHMVADNKVRGGKFSKVFGG